MFTNFLIEELGNVSSVPSFRFNKLTGLQCLSVSIRKFLDIKE